jgi:hypothetical protein
MWHASPGRQCPCCRSSSAGTPWACHQPSEMDHHSTRTVRAFPWFSILCQLLCLDLQHMILSGWELWDKYTRPRMSSVGKNRDRLFQPSLWGRKKHYCIKNSRNKFIPKHSCTANKREDIYLTHNFSYGKLKLRAAIFPTSALHQSYKGSLCSVQCFCFQCFPWSDNNNTI